MRKIKCYSKDDPFVFHQNVVARKRNASATTVKSLEGQIKISFDTYQTLFDHDLLQNLNDSPYTPAQGTALKDMYSFSAKPFRDLLKYYEVDEKDRIDDICPNCQIDTISSFDHLVPQTEYPEFSDNTLNLIPCCINCNDRKNNLWRDNGKRLYLNLFIDNIPNEQFLFAKVSMNAENPSVHFFIQNNGKIESDIFTKIENHYKKLALIQRFENKADNVLSTLAMQIQVNMAGLPDDEIIQRAINCATIEQRKYGVNYWKSVLQISVLNDVAVFNFLKTCVL